MYGGGYGGGWSPWSGGGGGNINLNQGMSQGQSQQQQQQKQQQITNPFQAQQQQQGGNMMGFSGTGANSANMFGMMGYPSSMNMGNASNLMGMTANANQQSSLMGMGNSNLYGSNTMGMTMGNSYGTLANPFSQQQQQQQAYLQQQNLNQSIFQTQSSFPRPQPPLPPGPPPKDQPSRDVSILPLFNNSSVQSPVPPPLPNPIVATPAPPPPLPVEEDNSSKRSNVPQPPPPSSHASNIDDEPKIPEQVLKLLRSAETARQFQQAAEALAKLSPLMSLNVSQDLFGTKSNADKKGGIPGLDFAETNSTSVKQDEQVKQDEAKAQKIDEKIDRVKKTFNNNLKDRSGDRKLDQKQPANWNEGRRTWMNPTGDDAKLKESSSKTEIKWELRSEIADLPTNDISHSRDINTIESSNVNVPTKSLSTATPKTDEAENRTNNINNTIDDKIEEINEEEISSSSLIVSEDCKEDCREVEAEEESNKFSASIPLASKDGKPVEYDRKTLRAFDKKFREWEKQFDNWKVSNDNHPDQAAYKKYMDQWNLWRQQLIEQRRFIIDSMNKARLEGSELALQKTLSSDLEDPQILNTTNERPTPPVKSDLSQSWKESSGKNPIATTGHCETLPSWKGSTNMNRPETTSDWKGPGGKAPPVPISARLASLASNQPVFGKFDNSNGDLKNSNNRKSFDIQKPQAPPPPLMSMIVEPIPPVSEKFDKGLAVSSSSSILKNDKEPTVSSSRFDNLAAESNSRSDRPVERILRDRDRPGFPAMGVSQGNVDSEHKKSTVSTDRVARDPHEQKNNSFGSDQKMISWELPNPSNRNPFEIAAQNQQNPFIQASHQNPWGSVAEDSLPTLSGFLKRDEFAVNQSSHILRPLIPSSSSDMNQFSNDRSDKGFNNRNQQISGPQGVTFEPTAKGMPLVTASVAPKETDEESCGDVSQWFTRDRRGIYEDDPENDEAQNEYDDVPSAVIDYGHGSGEPNEEDEYDLPRCERPVRQMEPETYDEYYEEEEEPKDVVTFDYGHGSVPPSLGPGQSGQRHQQPQDNYYEQNQYEEYEEYEQYQHQAHMQPHMQPHIQMNRGRFPIPRGRGRFQETRFGGPTQSQQQLNQSGHGYRPTPTRLSNFTPDLRDRETTGPYANRGKGRVAPPRFQDNEPLAPGGFSARQAFPKPQPQTELETERVDSPEVIVLDSPSREPRKAPPRDSSLERKRSDRVPRDGGRSDRGKDSSRERDSESRRRDRSRSRENEERNRSRKDKNTDERPRSERYYRDDEKRVRRDDSPQSRRDRDRDRDSRDRYGRPPLKKSRSKSRSPTFDRNRVPIYRNPPGQNSSGLHLSSNPPAPRYQTVLIEDLLNNPQRMKRPSQIVIILRGLPGSGKSYVAKLIKDREVDLGGSAPRMLSLDDYFMAETEKVVKDPLTGVEVKEMIMEYEYETDLEPKYRSDLFKTFKKNVENGYFQFIIVDGVNDQVKYFEEMVTFATQRRFQVYIAEVEESVENCVKRNIHHRTKEQIQKIQKNWERTPATYVKLDIRTLLQDEAVQDVEMEDVSDTENIIESEETTTAKKETELENWEDDENINNEPQFPQASKWEKLEPSEEKLNRLDGLARKRNAKDDEKVDSSLSTSIESWLQSHLPEDYISRQQTKPGQKRVRWADIEEQRQQERMREVGFVVGHTDWNRMTDPTFGQSALTKTKYI